ncbi:family 43 glycosylhydrolase [Streptomyces sp. FXJ1.172]|uniref:family 43 glycosylhydrolase n=1 Tax=Streptomyces sp. FXJ1.172 TaxID=710705 RepID=UPI000A6FCADE|nr:family 43 glycosylhydrolase [Streptomyces sp. FXJ1.172]WEO93271.1 family 43 glycosylhydrolase [Streptomyces sp. FXJ1.172]
MAGGERGLTCRPPGSAHLAQPLNARRVRHRGVPAAGLAAPPSTAAAATPFAGTWGDQGDGTYVNPVLPGDFSDWDCIRVGADYYGITSTFGYSPGVAVLHLKGLVNWRHWAARWVISPASDQR